MVANLIVAANVANQAAKFSITDTTLYGPVVNLSTQDTAKLLQQLKELLTGINANQIY